MLRVRMKNTKKQRSDEIVNAWQDPCRQRRRRYPRPRGGKARAVVGVESRLDVRSSPSPHPGPEAEQGWLV